MELTSFEKAKDTWDMSEEEKVTWFILFALVPQIRGLPGKNVF